MKKSGDVMPYRNQPNPMTPREVVDHFDAFVIGQASAKRAVAIALRNRWRRTQVPDELRDEIAPKNILMIGPTGVGKTEIARRLAKLAGAPFLKVEASKFTEVGYVGRDVESMIRDLVDISIDLVKSQAEQAFAPRVQEIVERRMADLLDLKVTGERRALDGSEDTRSTFVVGHDGSVRPEENRERTHLERLRAGEFDDEFVELEVAEAPSTPWPQHAESTPEIAAIFETMFPRKRRKKRMRVRDAFRALMREEAAKFVDQEKVVEVALERAQEMGIIFIDEIDKVAGQTRSDGPDVSREGVQRDLLPIVEGSTVNTRHGMVRTDHILFIAAGAFHVSKPSDLIPELQGRFPIRVELERLGEQELRRILVEPTNALTRQYAELMATEGVDIVFEGGGLDAIAEIATLMNDRVENIGARRLHTVMERVFEDLSFEAPERGGQLVKISSEYVHERLDPIIKDDDISRYIL
ncbi:MAG: ATP-dependent protease ATPase subunit HslU [bacterium]